MKSCSLFQLSKGLCNKTFCRCKLVGFAVPATLMGHLEVTAVTNPVAYYLSEKITDEKCFIAQAQLVVNHIEFYSCNGMCADVSQTVLSGFAFHSHMLKQGIFLWCYDIQSEDTWQTDSRLI